jgi:hypothetical protein
MLERPRSERLRHTRRQRAYRARMRNGQMVAPVEVGADILDLLVRLRWLDDRLAGDRIAVGQAITRMLLDAARGDAHGTERRREAR